MRNTDINSREEIRVQMQQALNSNDNEAFATAFDQMLQCIGEDVRAEYDQSLEELREEMDQRILTARGVHQLTSKENAYYQKVIDAMKSRDPKQALANLDVVMPETVIDSVFEDLSTNHPLLSKINFVPSGGAIHMMVNTNGYQEAVWGALCDDIVKELTSGFKEVNTSLLKLSAFLPVCKAMLELGPQWLDRYVREILYEAIANGMEHGIIAGDGNEEPIGMMRQVGEGVTVTGGVYPEKTAVVVSDFSPATYGRLLGILAVDDKGKSRVIRDVILVVSPADYFTRVFPAVTQPTPAGGYATDVLPYPTTVIQSAAVPNGKAVLGLAYRYFAAAGSDVAGRIEYSDHYHFIEDERVYLLKLYANGMPLDNNAFITLDISGIAPLTYKVEVVDSRTPSSDATLSDLRIGSIAMNFNPNTTTYTVSTTNATNTVTAIPTQAASTVQVLVNNTEIPNGTAATWQTGSNTVKVNVTAPDGKSTKAYTVTVTKS